MKTTNQPKVVNTTLEKFATVALNKKAAAMIKGGNGNELPLPNEIVEDIVNG